MAAPAQAPSSQGTYITEVVVQGIRRFADVRRFTLGPGYNVLFGLAASGKSTLSDVILSLLFARPTEGEGDSFRSMLPGGDTRALRLQVTAGYRRQAEVKTTGFLQGGLRTRPFEVETVIRRRDEAKQKLDEMQGELEGIEKVPKLPDGIDERIESYKRQMKTKEAEMEHLLVRQEEAHQQLAMVIPSPFSEEDMRRLHSPMDIAVAL